MRRNVMTLYSSNTDITSHQIRLVAAEKGVTIDILSVDTEAVAQELAEINPHNSIPTLVDRDLIVYPDRVIAEYLDERFPHPPLLPVYPVARAKMRLMLHRIASDWYPLVDKIQTGPAENKKAIRQELEESMLALTPVFADSPYFLSEDLSLLDCSIAPLLWRFKHLGVQLPKKAEPVWSYAQRIFERDAFQGSLTEAEREMRG